jgi:hypothetical protein
MWLEKLSELSDGGLKGPIKYLDLKFELHNAIYLIETLDSIYEFSINNDELCIKRGKEVVSDEQFLFWWQITRYGEILEEERKLINSYEEVKKKMLKLQKSLPKIEEDDTEKEAEKKQKKIEDINVKLSKLATWLNKEGPILKQNLQMLSNYRNIYTSEESIKEILKWIKFYLRNKV